MHPIALFGLAMVLVLGYMAVRANKRLNEFLRDMTDEMLADEMWLEIQDGYYPNPFSCELDRRTQERRAALVEKEA